VAEVFLAKNFQLNCIFLNYKVLFRSCSNPLMMIRGIDTDRGIGVGIEGGKRER
jgi:hypothetical protein